MLVNIIRYGLASAYTWMVFMCAFSLIGLVGVDLVMVNLLATLATVALGVEFDLDLKFAQQFTLPKAILNIAIFAGLYAAGPVLNLAPALLGLVILVTPIVVSIVVSTLSYLFTPNRVVPPAAPARNLQNNPNMPIPRLRRVLMDVGFDADLVDALNLVEDRLNANANLQRPIQANVPIEQNQDCYQLVQLGLQAIQGNHGQEAERIIDRLTALKGRDPLGAARQDNLLLRAAAHHGRTALVRKLLGLGEVSRNAGANHNEALREALYGDHQGIVQLLLPNQHVSENLTFNNNEVLRIAQQHFRLDAIQLLLQKRAVADFNIPADVALNFLPLNRAQYTPRLLRGGDNIEDIVDNLPQFDRANANNIDANINLDQMAHHEGAMRPLNARQKQALDHLKQKYGPEIQKRGRATIFKEIEQLLINAYKKKPVRVDGKDYPLEYNAGNSNEVNTAYHMHVIHGAYRLLFLKPNPWQAKRDGNFGNLSEKDRDLIAMMYLVATDKDVAIPEGYSRKLMLQEFYNSCYGLLRAHNHDAKRINARGINEYYDDREGDKPTCNDGVDQAGLQFYMVFFNDKPETRPLTRDMMINRFSQMLVADADKPGNIYRKLAAMTRDQLKRISKALENLGLEGDLTKLNANDRQILEPLQFTANEIEAFIEDCKEYFSPRRITQDAEEPLVLHGQHHFQTYQAFIRHLGREALLQFAGDIKHQVDTLLDKQKKAKKGEVLRFTDAGKKKKSKNNDGADQPAQKKKRHAKH